MGRTNKISYGSRPGPPLALMDWNLHVFVEISSLSKAIHSTPFSATMKGLELCQIAGHFINGNFRTKWSYINKWKVPTSGHISTEALQQRADLSVKHLRGRGRRPGSSAEMVI